MNAAGRSCKPAFSPLGQWNEIPVAWVREQRRDHFTRWGLPGLVRVDNGYPWGSKGDLPTDLALWLIGLGVPVWWNAPRHPEQNGVVERSQGTGKRWGEPHTAADYVELQRRLNDLDELQRCQCPYREQKSRMEWYAGLQHSGRVYQRADERGLWDWQRVALHLSGYSVPRLVDQKGQISIYNRNHYVGRKYGQQPVWLLFNGEACQWVITTEHGTILKEVAAEEVRAERILALEVTCRR
jgi:hypothetical protein